MLGLMVLLAILVYLAVSVGAVVLAARWAKKHNRRPWLWGSLAALIMYHIVFWDWIPTLVAHKYYCSTQAGFRVYQTPEEWRRENLGREKLNTDTVRSNKSQTYDQRRGELLEVTRKTEQLGDLFEKRSIGVLPITRIRSSVVDVRTDMVLAELVDYQRGHGNWMTSQRQSSWKFWLHSNSCKTDNQRIAQKGIHEYRLSIYSNNKDLK